MGCFSCFKGPSSCGVEDANKPDAFLTVVTLSTGMKIPVHALPADTIATIRRKIEREHGVQPYVSIQGTMVKPPIMAMHESKWYPVKPEVTMSELGLPTTLRFAHINDRLKKYKAAVNAHWAISNFAAFQGAFQ